MTQVNEMYKRLFTRSKVAASDLLVETTWADLFMKTENGQLIPGQMYRITDYTLIIEEGRTIEGMVEGDNMQIASAGRRFDIIVMALSERKLSESAFAMNNEDQDDFPISNLCAWELRYSLYNDSRMFDWAYGPVYDPQTVIDTIIQDDVAQITLSGGRTILMHVDRNDGEYEMFYSLEEDTYYYTLEGVEEEETFYTKVPYPVAGDSVYVQTQNGMNAFTIQSIQWNLCPQGKGVIYRMIDEFDNDLPYDFKNLMVEYPYSAKSSIESALSITLPAMQYTFSAEDDLGLRDISTTGLVTNTKMASIREYDDDVRYCLGVNLFLNCILINVEISGGIRADGASEFNFIVSEGSSNVGHLTIQSSTACILLPSFEGEMLDCTIKTCHKVLLKSPNCLKIEGIRSFNLENYTDSNSGEVSVQQMISSFIPTTMSELKILNGDFALCISALAGKGTPIIEGNNNTSIYGTYDGYFWLNDEWNRFIQESGVA